MMACARSSSWSTRPQAFSDLLVVKIIGAMAAMALVDDVEEHVGGVGAVGEIADFVDDQDGRMRVGRAAPAASSPARNAAERSSMSVGGGREEGVEAVLNRAVGDGDGQMRLSRGRVCPPR